ncbi:MAG TPA: methyltransferase domain-containing protein [Candidatus Krumholzibacteria bacterium]|nr:methyltransferase domain-containing protein [Candidatus Krumholzibacteria bacterium]
MTFQLPDMQVPGDLAREDMPDLLRHWYLGPPARRHMMLRRFAEVDRRLDAVPGMRVLDIGSAWGFNVMALTQLGLRAVGVDIVPDQFPVGKRIAKHNRVAFDVAGADASALPFPDASFDRITMVETFEHIFHDDRPGALSECRRVLRPGGRIVLSTPNHASAVERFKRVAVRHGWIRSRLPSMCYPDEGSARADYHPYRYHHPLPARDIASLLAGAGFEVTAIDHFLFTLKNTPDALFAPWVALENALERTPLVRGFAATVCLTATRPA